MKWDDLEVILAVEKTRTFGNAAKSLGVARTTIARRLTRIEGELGYRLFIARDRERIPTPECKSILADAREIGRLIERMGKKNSNAQYSVHGTVTISITPAIAEFILAPALPDFLLENPNLMLELKLDSANLNFSHWESDLAVRLNRPKKGNFHARRIATIPLYLCTPRNHSSPKQYIGYPKHLDWTPESQILANLSGNEQIKLRTNNLRLLSECIQNGHFSGILPSYLIDSMDKTKFDTDKTASDREVWLLTQSHLTHDKAINCVSHWITKLIRLRLRTK